jgi:transcriptional regulator with GAF, ATPase, and Fis domain
MLERETRWLRKIRDLSQRLGATEDLGALLPAILDSAVELTGAERGFLVLVEGVKSDGRPKTRVAEARGFDRASLHSSQVRVSRTVIRRVIEEERALVTTSESEDCDVMNVSSVRDSRVRSIACVPLRLRGETRGALYLDHRFVEEAFGEDDLPVLDVFANQAALALEWARLRARDSEHQRELAQAKDQLDALRSDEEAALLPAGSRRSYGALIGASPAMQVLYEEIERASRTDDTVLVLGETGSGHELVARELHARRSGRTSAFAVQTCAVSTADLAQRLFGTADRRGLFEAVGDGTLMLDDADQLTPDMQTRLLDVLKRRTWPGLAGALPLRCRLVFASHEDLRALVEAGELREDLYYRLDVMRIIVPPLRQRPGDVELLIDHLLSQLPRRPEISANALSILSGYTWPGNVLELENELRRLLALGQRRLSATHLSAEIREGRGLSRAPTSFSGMTLGQVEAEVVKTALAEHDREDPRHARLGRRLLSHRQASAEERPHHHQPEPAKRRPPSAAHDSTSFCRVVGKRCAGA